MIVFVHIYACVSNSLTKTHANLITEFRVASKENSLQSRAAEEPCFCENDRRCFRKQVGKRITNVVKLVSFVQSRQNDLEISRGNGIRRPDSDRRAAEANSLHELQQIHQKNATARTRDAGELIRNSIMRKILQPCMRTRIKRFTTSVSK